MDLLTTEIDLAMADLKMFFASNPESGTMDWLESKWSKMPEGINADHNMHQFSQDGYRNENVPLDHIVASSHNALWGDLDYRRDNYVKIVDAAFIAYNSGSEYDEWLKRMFSNDFIGLTIAASSVHGTLYRIGVNGNHRLHTLKAMGITAPIPVEVPNLTEEEYIQFIPRTMNRRVFDMLLRYEYIEHVGADENGHDSYRVLKSIPTWLLTTQNSWDRPMHPFAMGNAVAWNISHISRRYKAYFPEFGESDPLEKVMLDSHSLEYELGDHWSEEPEQAPAEIEPDNPESITVWKRMLSIFR